MKCAIKYFEKPFRVLSGPAPRNPYPSGYGRKIPTRYTLLDGKIRRRVYSCCFSNSGTLFVIVKGEELVVREEEISEGLERERNRPFWSLVDYFDVVGNEENGWEVNNLAIVEEEIYLDEEISEAELLKFLKRIGWMKKHVRLNMVEFEWSDGIVEISERKSSRPLGRLDREEKR